MIVAGAVTSPVAAPKAGILEVTMTNLQTHNEWDDITWSNGVDSVVLSPLSGGRVISWLHGDCGELVQPRDVVDGGLVRVLLGEERYPGASFVTPHTVLAHESSDSGFTVRMRYFWNTPNALARRLGWEHKVNPCYLDRLLLDKTVRFLAAESAFVVELAITNLAGEERRITPWLHNDLQGYVERGQMYFDGEREPFTAHDIYWRGHLARPGTQMRLVHDLNGTGYNVVLGARSDGLAGMASYAAPDWGAASKQNVMELRGETLLLQPGQQWRATAFLLISTRPEDWSNTAPVDLYWEIGEAPTMTWDENDLLPLLETWALAEERERGFMVLSQLDKVPFTSGDRFAAANVFAGFQEVHEAYRHEAAVAEVGVFALRDIELKIESRLPEGWAMEETPLQLKRHELYTQGLLASAGLEGKELVAVKLAAAGGEVVLRVPPDATLEQAQPYQVKQVSDYLAERWRVEKGGFQGTSVEELREWQKRQRQRMVEWTRDAVIGPAPLQPRLMERQVGPHCVRDKVLLQTEPGVWLPTYVIYPRDRKGADQLPAIMFAHGSGPGKLHFAPDETGEAQDPATYDRWPSPYQFAHQLNCMVILPDRRGWGEWSEANHGQRPERARRAGYNVIALEMWDHLCAIDYLVSRPDVDSRHIVSMGSSGGGWMTMFLLAMDERIAAGIVSSSVSDLPALPPQYFHRVLETRVGEKDMVPPSHVPLAPASLLCLAAPRILWIMDGLCDRGILSSANLTEEEARPEFWKWRDRSNAGRNEVKRIYELLGADGNYRSHWFEGDHLAGFTFRNIANWLHDYFGEAFPQRF